MMIAEYKLPPLSEFKYIQNISPAPKNMKKLYNLSAHTVSDFKAGAGRKFYMYLWLAKLEDPTHTKY